MLSYIYLIHIVCQILIYHRILIMFKRILVFRINVTIVFVYIGEVVWMNCYTKCIYFNVY